MNHATHTANPFYASRLKRVALEQRSVTNPSMLGCHWHRGTHHRCHT